MIRLIKIMVQASCGKQMLGTLALRRLKYKGHKVQTSLDHIGRTLTINYKIQNHIEGVVAMSFQNHKTKIISKYNKRYSITTIIYKCLKLSFDVERND